MKSLLLFVTFTLMAGLAHAGIVEAVAGKVKNGRYSGTSSARQPCLIDISALPADPFWGGKPSLSITIFPNQEAKQMLQVVYVENHPGFRVSSFNDSNGMVTLDSTKLPHQQYGSPLRTLLRVRTGYASIAEASGFGQNRSVDCQFR